MTWEEVVQAPSFTGLLNESYGSGAAAAYGTRRLNGNYSGNCMTIRRADGVTLGVGFVGEDIDESAITTFCSGSTCTVQVWHDQSGNGNDASQTDSTKQPTIYTGGALVKDGGRLALDFDGTDDELTSTTVPFSGTTHRTSFTVSNADTATSADIIYGIDGGTASAPAGELWQLTSESAVRVSGKIEFVSSAQTSQSLATVIFDGTTVDDINLYLNGSLKTQTGSTGTTINTGSTNFGIGTTPVTTNNYDGKQQELIFYASDKSTDRTDIEGNISGYYQSAKLLNEAYGSGAAAAYSVRLLDRDYTGSAVQLERTSDNSFQDIGFDVNGDLDESAITTFCTGTTCKVRTWYDQSGNANNAVQTDHTKQPTIYTGGAIVKENGRVAVDFDGTDDYFEMPSPFSGTTPRTTFFTGYSTETPATDSVIYGANVQASNSGENYNITTEIGLRVNQFALWDDDYQGTSLKLLTTKWSAGDALDALMYLDGNQLSTSSGNSSVALNTAAHTVGWIARTSYNPTEFLTAVFSEMIFYAAAKNSSDQTSIESNIGDYFTQNTPLLDTYSGAAAAYSLRKLRTAYTGAAIEVYNGTSYQDIGFNVFGELDTVSLAAFCGGNNGFVSKWYDQSGNANDATQTTTANQPKIYDGTTGVVTRSGKNAIDFTGAYSLSSSSGSMAQPNTTFAVSDFVSGKVIDAVTGRRNIEVQSGGNIALWAGSSPFTATTGGGYSGTSNLQIISTVLDGSNTEHKLNNNSAQTCAAATNSSTGFYFGGQVGSTNGSMYISEFVAYESDQSANRDNIHTNQNTFYSIY
jgi:hypothetical protein